jgi:alpha-mannosidase
MVQLRYSIGGDNGPPDPDLPEFVKKWNAEYVWPKLVIATTSELFREFERRYKDKIPEARGDFTPYWEDGAASSARETALARNAAERLVQAETLWSILNPRAYPAGDFYQAWRNVLLYNEHTWGAHCSITQPDSEFTKAQWTIKQSFAVNAVSQSRQLLDGALCGQRSETKPVSAADVYNTLSWPRTMLAVVPARLHLAGDVVQSPSGRVIPSQRLSDGDLVFVAHDVPALGAQRFIFRPGQPAAEGAVKVEGHAVENQSLRLAVDEKNGAIRSLRCKAVPTDLVADGRERGLNEFWYVAGREPKSPQPSGQASVAVKERGPVVASLVIASTAPGCRILIREVRFVDGLDRVGIRDAIAKERIRTPEGVHLRFAPNVPNGVIRIDVPWGVIRPEVDQLPGACKNYFSVGRWIDVSNDRFGLTCATIDAPMAEVGAIRTDVVSPFDPKMWVKKLDPAQMFYWYLMNNYWETNYKADNEGIAVFRYSLRPHGPFDAAAAARFGVEQSQPLVVVPVEKDAPRVQPMFSVEPTEVLLTSLKPSEDQKALMLRLYNAGDRPAKARVNWAAFRPKRVVLSSPREEQGPAWSGEADLPPLGILTLRAERE